MKLTFTETGIVVPALEHLAHQLDEAFCDLVLSLRSMRLSDHKVADRVQSLLDHIREQEVLARSAARSLLGKCCEKDCNEDANAADDATGYCYTCGGHLCAEHALQSNGFDTVCGGCSGDSDAA